jgi:hypothetical protein
MPPTTSCPSNYFWNGSHCTPHQTGGPNYYYPPTYYYPTSYPTYYQQPVSYYTPTATYYPATYYYPTTTYVQQPEQPTTRYNVNTQSEVRYVAGQQNITYVTEQPRPQQPVSASVMGTLETFNVRITSDANNTVISWDNNVPTFGEVVFGFNSQPADDQAVYSYDFTTGRLADLSPRHVVSLGQLEFNRVYYIRIISRTPDGATDVTSEMTFIPVPGQQSDLVVNQTEGSASALTTLGNLLTSGWLLLIVLLIAIAILLSLIFNKRRTG